MSPSDPKKLQHGLMRPAITMRAVAYKEQGLSYSTPLHIQRHYQWYCVIHGNVETTIDGEINALDAWDSILIPDGAERFHRCGDEAPGYFYVLFENHTLELASIERRVLTPPAELRSALRDLAVEMREAPATNTDEFLHALVVRVLIGLVRSSDVADGSLAYDRASASTTYARETVARVEAFMRRNLGRPLNREDFAEVAHLSPAHLARVFRAVAGKTMLQRLTELRMAAARELLATSTLPVTEIALEVGYNSFSHFSSAFRKRMGMTPSDYRAECNPTGTV